MFAKFYSPSSQTTYFQRRIELTLWVRNLVVNPLIKMIKVSTINKMGQPSGGGRDQEDRGSKSAPPK
jgi:hypothetical protein